MLKLARVGPDDFVVDLGSGDGRIVLTAATRYGARGLGVELDGELVALSNREAQRLGVEKLVSFRQEDALKASFREASVVTLYLLPELLNPLRDRILRELRPGTRVVAHDFPFLDWPPDHSVTLEVEEKYGKPGNWQSNLFLWIVPARVDGHWRAVLAAPESGEFTLTLTQKFQRIEGYATIGGERIFLEDAAVEGRSIRFAIPGRTGGHGDRLEFTGIVDGEVIRGTAFSPRGTLHWQAQHADSRSSHAP
jgi:16S rRNA G966 N2-methylase RsmD